MARLSKAQQQKAYDDVKAAFINGRRESEAEIKLLKDQMVELKESLAAQKWQARITLVTAVAQGFDALAHALSEDTIAGPRNM